MGTNLKEIQNGTTILVKGANPYYPNVHSTIHIAVKRPDELTTLPSTQTSTSPITSTGMSSSVATTTPGSTTTITTTPYVTEAGTNGSNTYIIIGASVGAVAIVSIVAGVI